MGSDHVACVKLTDDKRFLRKLKRQIKKTGNRKLRRHLKDEGASEGDFDYGRDRSDVMNEPRPRRREDEGDSG